MKRCWMCEFNTEPEARKLTQFIVEHSGTMGVPQLALAVHESLITLFHGAPGTSLSEVTAHITDHTLTPSVRIACILRSLLHLSDRLGSILTNVDENGNLVVDARNVNVYLKVVNEIMQTYKTGDVNRLMFSDHANAAGNGQMRSANNKSAGDS